MILETQHTSFKFCRIYIYIYIDTEINQPAIFSKQYLFTIILGLRHLQAEQISNNECISLLLHRCCCKTGSSGSVEGGTIHDMPGAFDSDKLDVLGINLFDAVTSCTPGSLLHTDILWPDASFCKYTVERCNLYKWFEIDFRQYGSTFVSLFEGTYTFLPFLMSIRLYGVYYIY